jgi:hypothetical protein
LKISLVSILLGNGIGRVDNWLLISSIYQCSYRILAEILIN